MVLGVGEDGADVGETVTGTGVRVVEEISLLVARRAIATPGLFASVNINAARIYNENDSV